MILVHLSKKVDKYPQGEYAVPTDHDWLSILDDDGLTLAMYPREKIVRVEVKAGETTMKSEDTSKA